MILGVDFDNTLVCYEEIFPRAAADLGLTPSGLRGKTAVRDHLQAQDRNDDWTRLQGVVYGARIGEAAPFPGAVAFLSRCRARDIPVAIISHKSRLPALGDPHDLHAAARRWLEENGVPDPASFHPTRAAKIAAIAAAGCTHFIDDLPEVFAEPAFPAGTARFLFDPADAHPGWNGGQRARGWDELERLLLP